MAEYIKMIVTVDGVETTVWQKTDIVEVQIVTQQRTSYVDANDQPVALPEVYEMRAVDGTVSTKLGS
jgi:hypothetical protein